MFSRRLPVVFMALASGAKAYSFWKAYTGPFENGTMDYRSFILNNDSASLTPNATGRIQFPGPDLSRPPPPPTSNNSSPDDDDDDNYDAATWTLNLNFTHVPHPPDPNATALSIHWQVETNLGLQQPESMDDDDETTTTTTTDSAEEWMPPCVTVYEFYPAEDQRYTDQASESGPTGLCDPYLGKECRDALTGGLKQSLLLANGSCSYSELPEACQYTLPENDGIAGTGSFDNATMELTPRNYERGVQFFRAGSTTSDFLDTDEEELNTAYDRESVAVFAVVLQWASSSQTDGDEGDDDDAAAAGINEAGFLTSSSLVCISATDFAPGSRVPDDTPDDDDSGAAALLLPGGFVVLKTFFLVAVGTTVALLV